MKKTSKGFTVLELLVVIAIITVLAAVILAALSTSRKKGSDAKIKQQLATIRTEVNLYTGPTANTLAYCNVAEEPTKTSVQNTLFGTANNGVGALLSGLVSGTGTSRCGVSNKLPSDGAKWAVTVPLSSGGMWCVDSTGVSRAKTAAGIAYTNYTDAMYANFLIQDYHCY